ncbi:TaqI-like C-terminal specificity domain-containing protein, partial [Empedobacter falsenii]
ILRGRDIKKYSYDFADLWLITSHNGIKEKGIKPIDINDYPSIKAHLDQFYSQLEKRSDKGDTPYNLRNCAYMDDFNSQNIAWQRITQSNQFCLTEEKLIVLDSMAFISNIKHCENYLLAQLNSKLVFFWVKCNVHEYGNTGFRLSNQYVEKMPLIKFDLEYEQLFKKLISTNQLKTIDQIIYNMYNLSKEEIDFIES